MPASAPAPSPTRRALTTRAVWLRAAKLGLPVGLVQVALNQGDHWLHHEITTGLVLKSILSPLLSFSIAFVSAVATHAGTSDSISSS
ncbi:MAG: hypothetical protein JNK23_17955 [Opitutaceae bacterium]|nr:hypothetical protein [Opitutaceae bacterium]